MESIARYRFYCGSNNTTKKPEVEKATLCLSRANIDGFSVLNSVVGSWKGEQEQSFIIEVLATPESKFNDDKATEIKQLLKTELQQYEVLTTKEWIKTL